MMQFSFIIINSLKFRSAYHKTYNLHEPISIDTDKIAPDEIPQKTEYPRSSFKCGFSPPKEHLESLVQASLKLRDPIKEIRPNVIYAPLRGAYPLFRLAVLNCSLENVEVYFPATSSFIRIAPKIHGHFLIRKCLELLSHLVSCEVG